MRRITQAEIRRLSEGHTVTLPMSDGLIMRQLAKRLLVEQKEPRKLAKKIEELVLERQTLAALNFDMMEALVPFAHDDLCQDTEVLR